MEPLSRIIEKNLYLYNDGLVGNIQDLKSAWISGAGGVEVRGKGAILGTILVVIAVAASTLGAWPRQEFPEPGTPTVTLAPDTYSGSVRVKGLSVSSGVNLYACIDDCIVYTSESVVTGEAGSYSGLVLSPDLTSLTGLPITFYLSNNHGRITAFEQQDFRGVGRGYTLDLSFDGPLPAPPAQATPTPTAILPATGDTVVAAIPTWIMAAGFAALIGGVTLLLMARRRAA